MKTILYMLLLFGLALGACKKDGNLETNARVATINVINAVTDGGAIKVNASGKAIGWGNIPVGVNYGAGKLFYGNTSNGVLIKAVLTTDTNKLFFDGIRNLQSRIYSLYLSGSSTAPDSLFKEEQNYPYIALDKASYTGSDSVVNIRFVNLSANSTPLKINIRSSTVNEVESLKYKDIGNWKAYPSKTTATTNYIFEVRDAASGTLFTTYTFGATATNRFKNVALVIRGLLGTTSGGNAFGVSAVNYF